MSKLHIGIFGPSLCGKSTLADAISAAMFKEGYRTIALDPNGVKMGPHAEVYTDEELFWVRVWSCEKCLIKVEESSETIARDKTLIPLFTRIRHKGHKLLVTGHNAGDLLNVMRRNITTLYLFQQSPSACDLWYEDTTLNKDIYQAAFLPEDSYEFIKWEKGKGCSRHILKRN